HRLIAGLVLAHVALHVIATLVIRVSSPGNGRSGLLLFALFMLGPSQATLLAILVAFGKGRFLWRVLPTVIGAIAYLRYVRISDPDFMPLTIGQLAVTGVLLLVARVVGVELVRFKDLPRVSRQLQFSIRDMLLWMTALAVVLSAAHYLPERWFPSLPVSAAIVVFGSFALVAIASMPLPLCSRWLPARLLLLPLMIGLGTAVLASRSYTWPAWYYGLLLVLMSAWITGSLLVVRWAGYRLTWQWPFRRKDQDETPCCDDG
ncbi:MAG: hypothetical protein ABSG68_17980, partial [Thermoguttaceae bacterium]